MKRSGKLLDAIGQIDDRYIAEAADLLEDGKSERPVKKTKTIPMRQKKTAAALIGLAACAAVAVWALDQGTQILPPEAKSGELPAADAAESTAEAAEAAIPQVAVQSPDTAAQEPGAEAQAPAAQGRMVPQESGTALRSAPAGAAEAPTARVSASDIQADASGMTCVLTNEDTENTLIFGAMDYLECLTEDGWQEVEPSADIGWEDILYELKPGESVERSWNLEAVYGTLESGQYRIGIPCEERNGDTGTAAVIYVEFGIE